jgi:hypothetical protein
VATDPDELSGERVVLVDEVELKALVEAELSHTVLGELFDEEGVPEEVRWIEAPDHTLLAMEEAGHRLRVLYLTPLHCAHALRGLDPLATQQAIRRRLQLMGRRLLDHATPWVSARQRRCLTLTACAHQVYPGEATRAHLLRGLDLLVLLSGEGRYDSASPKERMIFVVEAEALLRFEARDAGLDAEAAFADQQASAQAGWLAANGIPNYAQALPYVDPERVVHLTGIPDEVRPTIDYEHEPHTEWRDGLVGPLNFGGMERLRGLGVGVQVVYLSKGAFMTDLCLTRTQLARELEERAAGDLGAAGHVLSLRLSQYMRKRGMAALDGPQDQRDLLGAQAEAEREGLLERLPAERPWLGPEGPPSELPLEDLVEAERGLIADLKLFTGLAALRGQPSLEERYGRLSSLKIQGLRMFEDMLEG